MKTTSATPNLVPLLGEDKGGVPSTPTQSPISKGNLALIPSFLMVLAARCIPKLLVVEQDLRQTQWVASKDGGLWPRTEWDTWHNGQAGVLHHIFQNETAGKISCSFGSLGAMITQSEKEPHQNVAQTWCHRACPWHRLRRLVQMEPRRAATIFTSCALPP